MSDTKRLSAPAAAFFPPRAERERIDDSLTRSLSEAVARVSAGPVVRTIDTPAFRTELAQIDFERPRDLEEILAWTIARMARGIVQMSNPRHFGLINPGPTLPSQCADRVTSALNPQLARSASSPVPLALEAPVIRLIARLGGFPEGATQYFATGGSEANGTSLLCALTAAHPRFSAASPRV